MAAHQPEVAADQAGERLDRYLANFIPSQSRSQIQRLIEQGAGRGGRAHRKANLAVKAGDRITVDAGAGAVDGRVAEDIPLTIVYEDRIWSSWTNPPAWSCTRPPGTTRARW